LPVRLFAPVGLCFSARGILSDVLEQGIAMGVKNKKTRTSFRNVLAMLLQYDD